MEERKGKKGEKMGTLFTRNAKRGGGPFTKMQRKEMGSKEVCENPEISSGFTLFRGLQVLPLLNQLNQYRSVLYRFRIQSGLVIII